MRTRSHFAGVWLNDDEFRHLTEQCSITGLNTGAYIRKSIMGVRLRPRPPDTYPALLHELSAIGNNVNQIAYWANAQQSIREEDIREAAALIRQAWQLVKETV